MRYHWLARYLVKEWFPALERGMREEIVSEAVCRAWCSFRALDYRLMQSCICVAAQRKGLIPPKAASPCSAQFLHRPTSRLKPLRRAVVIEMADYR
jgi:hypothetical protein